MRCVLRWICVGEITQHKRAIGFAASKIPQDWICNQRKKDEPSLMLRLFARLIFNFLKKKTRNLKNLRSEICSPSSKILPPNQKGLPQTPLLQKPRAPARGDLGFDPASATTNHPAAPKTPVPSLTYATTAQDPAKESHTHYSNAKSMSIPDAIHSGK